METMGGAKSQTHAQLVFIALDCFRFHRLINLGLGQFFHFFLSFGDHKKLEELLSLSLWFVVLISGE